MDIKNLNKLINEGETVVFQSKSDYLELLKRDQDFKPVKLILNGTTCNSAKSFRGIYVKLITLIRDRNLKLVS